MPRVSVSGLRRRCGSGKSKRGLVMKRFLLCLFAVVLMLSTIAAPSIANVALSQDASSLVKITYNLVGEPGIVLLEILTNGVSIGESKVTHVVGDVNRRIAAGNGKTIWWECNRDAPDVDGSSVSAIVTAYSLDAPPDIMVLDLKSANGCMFYKSEAGLPDGGLANDVYRTSKLVMKKVHAKNVTFLAGNPGSSTDRYKPFRATFTYDYYLGIYEVTQGQQMLIDGNAHSAFTAGDEAAMRPVDQVNWVDVRDYYGWPDLSSGTFSHDNVESKGFLSKLRRCGLAIDLPTSVEWEYACRAGNKTLFGNGSDDEAGLDKIGWYNGNAASTTHPVGRKEPNAWGFYDMHGNVQEWTLDWFRNTEMSDRGSVTQTDYNGPSSAETYANAKTIRGGGIGSGYGECAAHVSVNRIYSANRVSPIGYRLCVRAEIP